MRFDQYRNDLNVDYCTLAQGKKTSWLINLKTVFIFAPKVDENVENDSAKKIFSFEDKGRASEWEGRKEQWDCSLQTMEEIQMKLQTKKEAALKYERVMAYSFSQHILIISYDP